MVALETLNFDPQLCRQFAQQYIDFSQRGRSILLGVAFSEYVQIDAVQHQNFLHIKPISKLMGMENLA